MSSLVRIDGTGAHAADAQLTGRIRFCSRCGTVEERLPRLDRPEADRVCTTCGMGVVLSAPGELLLTGQGAFMVVTSELQVSAVSECAEPMVGPEDGLLDVPLLSIMSSPLGDEQFAARVARAARGTRETTSMPVYMVKPVSPRLSGLEARIATCGPPRAALVAFGPAHSRGV